MQTLQHRFQCFIHLHNILSISILIDLLGMRNLNSVLCHISFECIVKVAMVMK